MKGRVAAAVLAAVAAIAASFPAAAHDKDYSNRLRGLSTMRLRLKQVHPQAGADQAAEIRPMMRELDALMDEMMPVMARLGTLDRSYADAENPAPLERERSDLRAKLEGQGQRLVSLTKAYNLRRKRMGLLQVRRLLTEFQGSQADTLLAGATELEDFYRVADAAHGTAVDLLIDEEASWQELLQKAAEAHWRRRAVQAGGAAFLLLAGIGGAAYWRRERSPAAVLSAPPLAAPSAPVALSGQAGTPALTPGAVLGGNYRVERELGRGGMGVVVEALDLTLQRRVALKLMSAELSSEPAELERFLAEARLVAALKHPNIVEIHTLFREGASLCLVFESVPGHPLSAYLGAGKKIAPASTTAFALQVASALDYAHDMKVIHRDLKPANIMVTPQGIAKVMDFGLAHQAKATLARVTRADSLGTRPYMAPEQELGEVSRESDLFAFGVCLYEMLTGELPFPGPNFLAQKREKRFRPPSGAGLPGGLDAVLARALTPEPEDRFHSAAELAAALSAAL